MTVHDTWILVSIPTRGSSRGLAARIGLALLGWSETRPARPARPRRSVALDRVARPAAAQRPFC